MTIATEKVKQSSDRFTLVRLTPGRYVGGDLALESGGIYTLTFPYPVARVERNGASLTEVTTVASNDEWSHDESTQAFRIKLASAPSATTNVIVVFYHIFYTDGPGLLSYETPTDSTTTLRYWEPRLLSSPEIQQSFKDVLDGVFSIRSSGISIANVDHVFQAYLTEEDSFSQKSVMAWIAINSTDNIEIVFTGKVSGLNVSQDSVFIDFTDSFSTLDQPAYLGDTTAESYFRAEAGSFPNMNPRDHNDPCPYIFGHSRVATFATANPRLIDGVFGDAFGIDYEKCNKAVCTDFGIGDGGESTSSNREWGLCRTSSEGFKALNFGTPTTKNVLDSTGGDGSNLTSGPPLTSVGHHVLELIYSSADHNLQIGDSFSFSGAAYNGGATHYAIVQYISDTKLTVQCQVSSSDTGALLASDTAITTLNSNSAPAIVVFDPDAKYYYFPVYPIDFSVTETALASGNKYLKITFANSFEHRVSTYFSGTPGRAHPGLTTIDPSRHIVAFRASQSSTGSPQSHANAMKKLVQSAGLTVNTTTFAAADVAFDTDVSFTVPFFDERDFSDYLKYCQAIASSTLGYLSVNSSQQIDYTLIAAPASGSEISDTDTLKSSFDIELSYNDIDTELRAENPHYLADISVSAPVSTSVKAKHLHGIDRRSYFRHVLTSISGRLSTILDLRSNRRATYEVEVAAILVDSDLGDDVTITNGMLLGSESSLNAKITSISKSADSIKIRATDLLGL